MTEAEAREFWQTHEFTEEYIASAPPAPDDESPPVPRLTKYRAVYLDRRLIKRATPLARRRGITITALLTELIERGLAAEEERSRAAGNQ